MNFYLKQGNNWALRGKNDWMFLIEAQNGSSTESFRMFHLDNICAESFFFLQQDHFSFDAKQIESSSELQVSFRKRELRTCTIVESSLCVDPL